MPRRAATSQAQLDAFARGAIVGMALAGVCSSKIAAIVKKSDGSRPILRAVQQTDRYLASALCY